MKLKIAKVKRLIGGRYYERKVIGSGLLTTSEVANLLAITQRHVYNLSKSETLHVIRKGKGKKKRLLFVYKDVQNYLETRR